MAEIDGYAWYLLKQLEAAGAKVPVLAGWEYAERPPKVEIPVLVKLASEEIRLFDYFANTSAQLGNIAACKVDREGLEELSRLRDVISIEVSRPANKFECANSVPYVKADLIHKKQNEKGDGAIIAIIDSGIDILHQAFLDAYGYTRILAIWDQTDSAGPAPKIGRILTKTQGTLHEKSSINTYIQNKSIPSKLNLAFRDKKGHGTKVASIAAGRKTGKFHGGMAPEASIIVIVPAMDVTPGDPLSLGYSNSHVNALAFIEDFVEELERNSTKQWPVVVNVSQGMNAGAHDGQSALEAAFNKFTNSGRATGRAIVKAAGNECNKERHAEICMLSNSRETLQWISKDDHYTKDEIELWYDSTNDLSFRLIDPDGSSSSVIDVANSKESNQFSSGNTFEIELTKSHVDNAHSRLLIHIEPGNAGFVSKTSDDKFWNLEITARSIAIDHNYLDAWIENRDGSEIEFANFASSEKTISIPGTAAHVITVGSVSSCSNPCSISEFSSWGPTRDNKYRKPELMAPGQGIEAAKANTSDDVVSDDGTSFAAPHVTGAIAMGFAYRKRNAKKQLSANQIAAALTHKTQNMPRSWQPSSGYGVLDVDSFFSELDKI